MSGEYILSEIEADHLGCGRLNSLHHLATNCSEDAGYGEVGPALGNFVENYCGGNLYVAIKLYVSAKRRAIDIGVGVGSADDKRGVDVGFDHRPGRIKDRILRNVCRSDDGHQNHVLIRHVQTVKCMDGVPLPIGEGFNGYENIFHALRGRFHSVAHCFKARPAIRRGEFEVAILFSPVSTNKLPCHKIEAGPQIVDSVAYYQGPIGANSSIEVQPENLLSRLFLVLDADGVRVGIDETGDLSFKVVDVMVGAV